MLGIDCQGHLCSNYTALCQPAPVCVSSQPLSPYAYEMHGANIYSMALFWSAEQEAFLLWLSDTQSLLAPDSRHSAHLMPNLCSLLIRTSPMPSTDSLGPAIPILRTAETSLSLGRITAKIVSAWEDVREAYINEHGHYEGG